MADYWTRYWQTNRNRRRFLGTTGAAGLGLAGLSLVGCGDDDDANPTAGSGSGSPASSTQPASQPKQGGTLRYPIFGTGSGDPPTLYPYENISYQVQTTAAYHYSRLMRGATGPDIEATDYTKVEGDLAEGLPEQPDDITYTFKFKPNITFHDKPPMNGRAATSQDFLATYDYFVANAINASRFNQLVDKLEAPDDSTIKITLKEPNAPFLVTAAASDQGVWFIPIETINNDQVKGDPVGSGPFVFRSYETGVKMSWDRHPAWYDAPRPYFEHMEAAILRDPQRIFAALKTGDFDHSGLLPDQLPQVEAELPSDARVTITKNSSINTFMFNFDNTPWGDKRVRQALSMALDRDGFLEVSDPTGEQPWNSFFGPANVPYYMDPRDDAFGDNGKYFEHNITEAKALLSAAGYPDGLDVNVISNVDRYGPSSQQLWEVAVSTIRDAGFNAQNVFQEYGAYIQSSYFGKIPDPLGINLGPIFGNVLDPDDIFFACYWSGSSRHNWSGTPPPEQAAVDALYLKQRSILDIEERTSVIQDIQREMADYFLVIPVVNGPAVNYIQPWVKDAYHKVDYAVVAETYQKAYFTDERIARG